MTIKQENTPKVKKFMEDYLNDELNRDQDSYIYQTKLLSIVEIGFARNNEVDFYFTLRVDFDRAYFSMLASNAYRDICASLEQPLK
jgi:hypothetical protein